MLKKLGYQTVDVLEKVANSKIGQFINFAGYVAFYWCLGFLIGQIVNSL